MNKINQQPITELVRGRAYGDNAQEIYLRCCDAFGWDKSQAECFTHGHRLYSPEDCDFNGNSVWFICYSNLANTEIVKDKHVRNFFENNGNRITENLADIEDNHAKGSSYNNRIVFAKYMDNKYHFCGVFKLTQYEHLYRVHELISDTYPMGK